ncbi:histone-lysine N-methyltransferase SETMAR [Plakobranchus ocellatus]|uniref:Histone-lysine N-methyltransferase SETMAR n=1 Tax=Plakobranchus ocellatus TaxID=259542 RepID=A0AAV3XV00_9GAST|nr:histone-lysine N-methyltransferase SETMAR [Plakobranchus ocellatus]
MLYFRAAFASLSSFSFPWMPTLLLGCGGAAQWRLDGPNKWTEAAKQIRKTPVPDLWRFTGYFLLFICLWLTFKIGNKAGSQAVVEKLGTDSSAAVVVEPDAGSVVAVVEIQVKAVVVEAMKAGKS